jgi:hypothetical protein
VGFLVISRSGSPTLALVYGTSSHTMALAKVNSHLLILNTDIPMYLAKLEKLADYADACEDPVV